MKYIAEPVAHNTYFVTRQLVQPEQVTSPILVTSQSWSDHGTSDTVESVTPSRQWHLTWHEHKENVLFKNSFRTANDMVLVWSFWYSAALWLNISCSKDNVTSIAMKLWIIVMVVTINDSLCLSHQTRCESMTHWLTAHMTDTQGCYSIKCNPEKVKPYDTPQHSIPQSFGCGSNCDQLLLNSCQLQLMSQIRYICVGGQKGFHGIPRPHLSKE